MVSKVRPRPNHYETLGVAPTATGEEIERAFASGLYRPRPFGGLAHLGIAYETLRDSAKRQAYDRSIGLTPDPEPHQWSIAAPRWTGTAFNSTANMAPARQEAAGSLPAVTRSADPEPQPEPRTAPFIATALREPAVMDSPSLSTSAPASRPPRTINPAADQFLTEAENGVLPWKRVGIAGGALVLAVGLLGAWAGWEASNDLGPQQPEQAMTVSLPPAKPLATTTPRWPAVAPRVAEARPEPPVRRAIAVAEIERPLPRPVQLTQAEEQQLAGSPFVESATQQIETVAAEQSVAQAPPAAAVAASLPLSNRVIARTIQRIGYACGQVASTTAVENGAPGVFKVTCTSGHSYRVQPIRGRYHFRRLGAQ